MKQIVDDQTAAEVAPKFETINAAGAEESVFSDNGGRGDGVEEDEKTEDEVLVDKASSALDEADRQLEAEEEANEEGEVGDMTVSASLSKAVDPLVASSPGDSATDAPKDDEVVVTQEEKDAFIDAVIRGVRYEAPFSLFGGRVRGVFRGRTNEESTAIDAYSRAAVRDGLVTTNYEFSNLIRLCLLTASVKEMDGTAYPEMPKGRALFKSVDPKTGADVDPEWLGMLAYWRTRPDALVSALMSELMVFESKYWKMASRARDENFWKTGASTEG